jgi:hypothetical protein
VGEFQANQCRVHSIEHPCDVLEAKWIVVDTLSSSLWVSRWSHRLMPILEGRHDYDSCSTPRRGTLVS